VVVARVAVDVVARVGLRGVSLAKWLVPSPDEQPVAKPASSADAVTNTAMRIATG